MNPYQQLWGIVDGAVADAIKMHPDYLTPKGQRSARSSITKRVTGTVIGFAAQAAKGRATKPADTDDGALLSSSSQAGDGLASPAPHCRIGRIRFKRRVRYRAAQAFDLTTSMLLRETGYQGRWQ